MGSLLFHRYRVFFAEAKILFLFGFYPYRQSGIVRQLSFFLENGHYAPLSLARAFTYAGAKSIVTSLWSVNDKSTSELMRLFYRELRQGKDKDEALRLARQRFLKESSVGNGHPFFWAAFVPVGDMGKVR